MKLQFDAKQAYQVDAVSAIVDLFDGQPLNKPDYATILQTFDTELFGSVGQTDLGIGNKLIIDRPTLLKNLQRVQERNEVDNAVAARTSLLEPIMIIGLAAIVGSIVIALFLPLIKMMEVIGPEAGGSADH